MFNLGDKVTAPQYSPMDARFDWYFATEGPYTIIEIKSLSRQYLLLPSKGYSQWVPEENIKRVDLSNLSLDRYM